MAAPEVDKGGASAMSAAMYAAKLNLKMKFKKPAPRFYRASDVVLAKPRVRKPMLNKAPTKQD